MDKPSLPASKPWTGSGLHFAKAGQAFGYIRQETKGKHFPLTWTSRSLELLNYLVEDLLAKIENDIEVMHSITDFLYLLQKFT